MIQFADILKAIGPNASIIFAAWIFMGFLQQRYDSASDRYRDAVGDYRSSDHGDDRGANLKDQVLGYRHRCRLMSMATLTGLVAAILLIASLILGAIDVIVPRNVVVTTLGTVAAIGGFVLVIAAAIIVIVEARIVVRQIDDELRDVPDLVDAAEGKIERNH